MEAVANYGTAYLDTESFRASAAMFGVGMSLACDYPATTEGDAKLAFVLQSASRHIDAFCARDFIPADKSEQHPFNLETWRFSVNNPPVTSIVSCAIRYGLDSTITIPPADVFINNQQKYLEIIRRLEAVTTMEIGTELLSPVVEIVYKSLQAVPINVKLACGYQAGHLMNSGFVDKILPPNFGKIDMEGFSVNNKKGYRSSEEMSAGSFSAEAERLLIAEKKFSVA